MTTTKKREAAPLPVEDLVAPFLLGPFRLLDKLFSGGRVTAAFGLGKRPAQAVSDRATLRRD